jgi:NAD(P)-dependent dehydrogenase (short-subunit alcohol dehydrogenase family)
MSIGQDRAVVITGASTGIGAACALRLDRLGFRVFAGVRKPEDGEALQRRGSTRLTTLRLDVTDTESIARAKEFVAELVGEAGLFGLINNAGIAVAGPLEAVPIADLRKQFEVNVIGQVAVTQAFLALLRKSRGRIVNMGSIAGRAAMPLMGPYSASKFALEALTDALRLEVLQWGIQVSIVEPGAIATPIWQKSGEQAEELARTVPEEMKTLYAGVIAGVRTRVAEAAARAIPAEVVAEAVEHALTSARPKTRYLVGHDAKIRALMIKLLPDRLSDWLMIRILNLPR